MEITISSRNLDLSESLVATVQRKLSRLGRNGLGMTRAEVHFSEERNPRITDREICEVLMEGNGNRVRCRVSATDGFAAMDKAVAKIEQQMAKLKTRASTKLYAKV